MLLFFQCSMNLPKKPKAKTSALADLQTDQLLHAERIEMFLMKLHQLQASKGDSSLRILHIGDSHIQMGYFSGEIRNTLQQQFGGQGIGIFFPNSLCSGFNPLGLDISSPSNWQCEKITSAEPIMPLGITGMGMKTDDAVSTINVSFKGKKEKVKTFTIFHANLDQTHEISCENADIVTKKFSETSSMTVVTMHTEVETAVLQFKTKSGTKESLMIYGLSVNSPANHGIDYSTFGVSGGQYKYFTKNTPLLSEQVAAFKPDLMIISLGSNDSYDKNLTMEGYKTMLRDFIIKLRKASPKTEFILTTPPDTKYKDSKPVSGHIVQQSILEIGAQANCAVWDFYSVMGGYGSLKKWRKENLGNKDGLHLTSEGYYLQGQLFNLALARALEQKYPGSGWVGKAEQVVYKTLKI